MPIDWIWKCAALFINYKRDCARTHQTQHASRSFRKIEFPLKSVCLLQQPQRIFFLFAFASLWSSMTIDAVKRISVHQMRGKYTEIWLHLGAVANLRNSRYSVIWLQNHNDCERAAHTHPHGCAHGNEIIDTQAWSLLRAKWNNKEFVLIVNFITSE